MFQILSVGAEVGEVEAGKKVSNQNLFSFNNINNIDASGALTF